MSVGGTDNHLGVVIRFTAKDGRGEDVLAAFKTAANAVRSEPGTLDFTMYRSNDAANVFFVTERYADQAALDQHQHGAAVASFGDVQDMIEEVEIIVGSSVWAASRSGG